ncbi:DUF6232 family protein [Winogradskya humida]|uniref:Uncharacterized protein n=1 Tax=Winogradskya humida TaxID=113566 RepID=A0ABQ3ZM73_9ACTN|nr:DUF6232 family protein [Actinoplanes humidus]GIE19682.1 hypothetical protein Ahu01nite_027840 [Actinoplanes humidus]
MRTYYRSREVLVTDEYFVWRASTTQIVPIGELRDVRLVRGEASRVGIAAMVATTAGLVTLAGASWAVMGQLAGYALAATATMIAAVAVRSPRRRATRVWNVEATLRGSRVIIYSSPDLRVFNQVTRALRRTIEVNQPGHDSYGLAAA